MSKSTHIPELSGGEATTSGSTGYVDVDTGLRDLLAFVVTQSTAVSANEESHLTIARQAIVAGTTRKVRVSSTKGGSASGSTGDTAIAFEWLAIGN